MIRKTGKYSWQRFLGDCGGGMIAALIALPYGLSMAALMQLPPVLGVITSILTAPVTALLGRNPVMIGGTASVTVPFIAAAARAQGIGGAAKVSIVASVLLMMFCVLRLGRHAARVPTSVVAGFSAGIGGVMVISQLNVLLDLPAPAGDSSLSQLSAILGDLPMAHLEPLLLGGIVMVAASLCTRWAPLLPAPLIGVGLSGLTAGLLRIHPVEVGSLRLTIPPFAGFSWSPEDVLKVLPSGLALAFVSAINLLLTSRVVEHFRGRRQNLKRRDADAELGAYGIANLFAGIFGAPMSVGIPARSLANVRCGGTTRVSNILHAVFLFALVELGAGMLARVPLAALAGVTAWMGLCLLDWGAWRRLPKMRLVDSGAFLLTAVAVLMFNAVSAVLLGCSVHAVRFAYRKYFRRAERMPEIAAGVAD